MKQILILLILSFGLLVAADEIDCIENRVRSIQNYYTCAGEYSDDFIYWLMKFLNYGEFNSTNLDDVAAKSTAICAKFAIHVQCVENRLTTIGESCMQDFGLNEQFNTFKRNLLNYFCDDKARKLRDAIGNNGYVDLTSNNLNLCMAAIDEDKLFTDADGTIILNVGYVCPTMSGMFTCLKSSVEAAQNKNLLNILQDLLTIIHDMLECPTN